MAATRARERDVYVAFYTEWMARQKELGPKSLDKLLKPRGGKQTPLEMRAAVMQIAAQYGMKTEFRPKQPS